MSFSVRVEGIKEIAAMHGEIISQLDAMEGAFQELGDATVADINDNIQNEGHVVTGETLSHSKVFEVAPDHVDVGNDAPWIEYLERGRGPVVPVTAEVLHWIDPEGNDVFSKYSGPTEPTFVVESAVLRNAERFTDIVVKRIDQHID